MACGIHTILYIRNITCVDYCRALLSGREQFGPSQQHVLVLGICWIGKEAAVQKSAVHVTNHWPKAGFTSKRLLRWSYWVVLLNRHAIETSWKCIHFVTSREIEQVGFERYHYCIHVCMYLHCSSAFSSSLFLACHLFSASSSWWESM